MAFYPPNEILILLKWHASQFLRGTCTEAQTMSLASNSHENGRRRLWNELSPSALATLRILIALSITCILVVDLLTPIKWSIWLVYLLPIFAGSRLPDRFAAIKLASFCSCLVIADLFFSVSDVETGVVILNRAVGVVVFLIIGLQIHLRNEAEIARHLREVKFRAAVEGMSDGFWMFDLSGRTLEVNDAYSQLSGYTVGELLGMSVADLDAVDNLAKVRERFQIARETGFSRFESRHRRKNGSTWPVEVTVSFWAEVGYFIVFIRDITDRLRAKEDIREKEERLRLALESANQGIYDLNLQTGDCTTSPEYASMLGYDPTTFHETNAFWIERLHPDDRDHCIANFEDYVAGRIPAYRIEFRQKTRDGNWKWTLSLGKIVKRDASGTPIRMLGTHTDISASKEAEERWRLFAENVPAALAMFDSHMRYVSYSRRWLSDYGLKGIDLFGRSHYDVFPEIPEHWKNIHKRALAGEVLHSEGEPFHRSNGKVQIIRWEVRPWFQSGQIAGIVIFSDDITERVATQTALAESETRQRQILDAVGDAVFGLDAHLNIQFANPAAIFLFGYSEEEFLAKNLHALLHKNPGEEHPCPPSECPVIQSFRSSEIRTGFVRLWRKDGKELSVDFTSSSYLDSAGARHIVVTFRDVSDRQAAQQALQVSEERLRGLIQSAPIGLLAVDAEGFIILANSRIEECFGYSHAELMGMSVDLLVPDRFREAHIAHRRRFAANSANSPLMGRDLLAKRKDRSEFPIQIGLSLWKSSTQTIVFATIDDISERKKAENALRASEDRYRKVMDQGIDPLFIMDQHGRFLDVNRSACASLGYSRTELLALGVHDIDSAIDATTPTPSAVASGHAASLETRHRRKDGTEFPVEVRCAAVQFDDEIRHVAIARDISDRLRAEEELRQSHRFLRSVIDSLSAHIAVLDESGQIITTNKAWDNFGRDNGRSANTGMNYLSCCTDEDYKIRSDEVGAVIEGIRDVISGQKNDFQHDYSCPSPTENRWFTMRVTPFQEKSPRHVVVSHENITNIKQAEIALAQMNERLEKRVQERTAELSRLAAILDASPDFIAVSSAKEGKLLYCNAAIKRASHLTGTESIEHAVQSFHPERSARRIREEALPEAAKNGLWLGETDVLGLNGAVIPVSQLILAHRGAGGEVEFFSTVMRDLSESKKLTAKLRVSEERFRLIASTIQDAFWMATPGAKQMLYVSPGYEHLWGKSCQSLYDDPKSFADAVHPDDRPAVLETVTKHQGRPYDAEYRLLREDGTIRWVHVRGYFAAGFDEVPQLMVGTATDVTERRVAEDALRERSEELAIANAGLAKASRLKDEFLASMSHELRTPLNGVLAISEAMQENVYGAITTQQATALRDIEQSGRHLLALINDILDLSKVEAGRIVLEPTPTDVEALCQSAQRIVKETAHKKRLRISTSVDSSLGTILIDERRLKQILVNLLSNAVKFTPDGGAVGLEAVADAEHQMIRFTVSDTGIGIRQEDMGLLFRPFQQIDSRLSREYSGTGLGLALVRRLTELNGGGVSVESEPGKGSRFTVSFPWRVPMETLLPELGPDEISVKKIVMVEDSLEAADQMKRYLNEMHIEAIVHPGVTGAIERIRAERPDLILLDILLPDGDGWQILGALKADAELSRIPVIVVSVVDDRNKAMQLGAFDLLLKPINREVLAGAISRLTLNVPLAKAVIVADPPNESYLILIAEDNPVNAKVMRDALRAAGYRVEWALDGRQAVDLACKLNPDLILMDIQMPGMDGLEAIRRIRADQAISKIPLIAVTALALPGDRDRCLLAGADDYVSKPVSLKALLQLVSRTLGRVK